MQEGLGQNVSLRDFFDEKFDSIHNLLEHQNKELAEIKTQTIKTNGRVTGLEKWREKTEPLLNGIENGKRETLKRWIDIFWSVVKIVAVAIFFYLLSQLFPDAFKVVTSYKQ